jgi:predicted permease
VASDIVEAVRRVPGVTVASVTTHTPLSGSNWSEPAGRAGQPIPDRDNALFVGAGPRFFATMGTAVLAGREFTERDSRDSPAVAVVNEAFAAQHFGRANPIGEHLAARVRGERRDLEIVGIAKNTSASGLRAAPPPTVYVAYRQLTGDVPSTIVVRAGESVGRVSSALQQTIQSRAPETAIEVKALSSQVQASIVQERMLATLGSGFGLLALTLTCVGLYGLLAYGVAQRTREIGVRIALGAHPSRVVRIVLSDGARLVTVGIAAGVPIAWAASRWVESLLFGRTPTDPAVLGGAIVMLVVAAQAAAYLPARRASRVDPLVALRHD